jgi:RimJ/RimL family protein N-acetyltransferase
MAQRGRHPLLGAWPRGRDRADPAPGRGVGVGAWPPAAPLQTERLELEPLRIEHAAELAALLDDAGLHRFTGGRPETLPEVTARVRRQVAGASPDGRHGWLNWVLRRRTADRAAAGTVQATLTGSEAELAWVVATAHQGRGYASEAAIAVRDWLRTQGIEEFTAHIHPDHAASGGVARRLGLVPTAARQDGEVRWAWSPK